MKVEVSRLVAWFDRYQQRHAWLGFPIAVVRKFGEDQASNLAALLAYYAFFSFFPLLLVLVTVLGLLVAGHPKIEEHVVRSVLSQFPVIGDQIRENAHSVSGSGLALVVGMATALWAGLALANAAQNALNTVWQVPIFARPNFIFRTLRSLLLVVVAGAFVLLTTTGNALVAGARSYGLGIGGLAGILAIVVSLLVNVLVFALGFRVLTDRDIGTRDVLPGAVVAAVGWQALQLVGGYYLAHRVKGASQTYGTFAIVIGLLTWFYLQAQLTLFAAELNVVRCRKLWPRSIVAPPPQTSADRETYQGYAEVVRFHPDERVETSFAKPEPKAGLPP
jgi:membrane protein